MNQVFKTLSAVAFFLLFISASTTGCKDAQNLIANITAPADSSSHPASRPSSGNGSLAPPSKNSPLAPAPSAQPAKLRANNSAIADGDTLRAVGFDKSIRLLQLDTEELLKDEDLIFAERDWPGYVESKTQKKNQIATYGTPLGNQAADFARSFFDGIEDIYVEYESPLRTRDFFGRHLAYVWIQKHGDSTGWLNYNIEAVRAGMSPYYTKYGSSERYHDAFVAAENEAKAAKRGIWAPNAKAYPDYNRREREWAERAKSIRIFRERFQNAPEFIELGTDVALSTLRERVGQRVTVAGFVDRYSPGAKPPKIQMSHRYRENVVVVAKPPMKFPTSEVSLKSGEFIYAEGTVTLFRGSPQIEFDSKSSLHSGKNPPSAPR